MKMEFDATKVIEEIVMQAKENQEEFIFETIRPYCENILQMKINKEELKQILLKSVQNQQPCNDCISREAVNALIDELARAISDERCFVSRGRATSTIMQDILELPSVTPKQKVGKWIDMKYKDEWWCPVGKCLNCGKEHILGSNYCPNCGADMRGEVE